MRIKVNYFDLGVHRGEGIQRVLNELGNDKRFNLNIYGIEANPEMCRFVSKRFIKDGRVKIINKAISEIKEDVNLYMSIEAHRQGSSIYRDKYNVTDEFVTIPTMRLSEIINPIKEDGQVDIIKANIEGAEYDLVKDLKENNLLSFFDIYFGPRGNWYTDIMKVASLVDKKGFLEQALKDAGVVINRFAIRDSQAVSVKQKLLEFIEK